MAHSAPHSLAPAAGFVSPALSQRALVFAGIVGFHVLLVIALANGLATSVMDIVRPPLVGEIIPDKPQPVIKEQEELPPNVIPFTTIEVEKPIIDINDPPVSEDPLKVTLNTSDDPPVVAEPLPQVEPLRLVGRHVLPNTEDYYPPQKIREGVQGATNVQVCVDEHGKRQGEPTVMQSSGDAQLDRGALAVARAGRYARTARGETFVPTCYAFRIIFTLQGSK